MKIIVIGIVTITAIIGIVVGTFWYAQIYEMQCVEDGGKLTSTFRCTHIRPDHGTGQQHEQKMFEIHDAVVHIDLSAYSFEDEHTYMVVRVVEFLKNPTNATHLTIWGNFHEFKEYCGKNECDQAIAYLYQDKNGIYHKGDYWEWLDYEKPTLVKKSIQCYEMFHCDLSDSDKFSSCIQGKINGQTISQICTNPDITTDGGCVTLHYQNTSTVMCE